MYFPGMKLGSKIFSFIDIFMATYQRSPKTETAGPLGERVQPFAIPAHPCVRNRSRSDSVLQTTETSHRPIGIMHTWKQLKKIGKDTFFTLTDTQHIRMHGNRP